MLLTEDQFRLTHEICYVFKVTNMGRETLEPAYGVCENHVPCYQRT